ncbi:hypothetical protein [Pseudonocardia sp. GCM10023141]|uniref:hypothetical protein n=1 Tax=Pseudonocardia sp. GCM10023141 TaxID=3252653 RepID=UPI0036089AC8
MESDNSGPDVDAMAEFWAGLIGPGQTLFAALRLLCAQIATLCERHAVLVQDTHTAVRRAVGIMIATGVVAAASGAGPAVLGHVALGEVELLLNPAADAFAARLPAEVLTAIDRRPWPRSSSCPPAPRPRGPSRPSSPSSRTPRTPGCAVPTHVAAEPTQPVPRFSADRFANPVLAARHANDHAAEFGLTGEQAYAAAAADFLTRAQSEGYPALVDGDGVVRVYDPSSNTLASYDSTTGVIKTYFRPTSTTYWQRRAPDWGMPVSWE